MSAYAERVGKDQGNISRLVSSARVTEKVCNETYLLMDKTAHLSHVHALPESAWQPMVDWIIDNSATVAQTIRHRPNVTENPLDPYLGG